MGTTQEMFAPVVTPGSSISRFLFDIPIEMVIFMRVLKGGLIIATTLGRSGSFPFS